MTINICFSSNLKYIQLLVSMWINGSSFYLMSCKWLITFFNYFYILINKNFENFIRECYISIISTLPSLPPAPPVSLPTPSQIHGLFVVFIYIYTCGNAPHTHTLLSPVSIPLYVCSGACKCSVSVIGAP